MALTPEAIRTLGEIMQDPSVTPGVRVTAAEKILDRALGKPAQTVDVTSRKDDAYDYSIAELVAIAYRRGFEGGSVEHELGSDPGIVEDGQSETVDISKG